MNGEPRNKHGRTELDIWHRLVGQQCRIYFDTRWERVNYIFTCMSDSRWGFGLDTGFIDHFNTQLVITLNYSTITNFHTLNKSLEHMLSLFQPAVSSFVVARYQLQQWLFLSYCAQVLSEWLLPSNCKLSLHFFPLTTPRHRPPLKTPFPTSPLSCVDLLLWTCCSYHFHGSMFCLPSTLPSNDSGFFFLISQLLHSNRSTCNNMLQQYKRT
jgi:hypothetical protein